MLASEAGETGPDGAAVYNGGVVELTNLEKLHSARGAHLSRGSGGARPRDRGGDPGSAKVGVGASSEEEIRAVRRTRLGFRDDVTVRLVPLESGDHTNTHAKIESRSHVSLWDLGQNKRNLKELLGAVNENLIPETDAS